MMRTHVAVGLVGAVLCLAGFSFFGFKAGLGVVAGACIASFNLFFLSRTVHNMVEGRGASWVGIAILKFTALLAVTYVLVESALIEPLGLAVGFAALPFGILLGGTTSASANHSSISPSINAAATAETDHA